MRLADVAGAAQPMLVADASSSSVAAIAGAAAPFAIAGAETETRMHVAGAAIATLEASTTEVFSDVFLYALLEAAA